MKCWKQGAGRAIVLVHELGGSVASWEEHVEELARTNTVITVELPGHDGLSVPQLVDSKVGRVVDFDQVAGDLAETIREQGGAPAVVIGHSLGGTIAARVPLVDPGAARAVVIVDSTIGGMQVPTEQRQALVEALTHDREAALRGFYGGVARSDQVGRIVASSLRMPAETWLSYLLANTVQAIRDGGRALAVPVLLQASSILLPPGADEKTRLAEGGFEHVRDLTVDHFPGAMHWIHWEDARGWRASFDRFLARLP